jgi:hypothetical protein
MFLRGVSSMGKVLLVLSAAAIGILLSLGIWMPESSVMWIASTSQGFTEIRAVLFSVLIALLVTNPPRNPAFRAGVGACSTLIAVWAISSLYTFQMQYLDTLALLLFSISSGLAVLELEQTAEVKVPQKQKKSRPKTATSIPIPV